MWQLASALGEIVLRRRGPESLPESTFLVGLLLVAFIAVNLVDFALFDALTGRSLLNLLAQVVLVFAFVYGVLAFFRLERRYRQTLSAILGINTILYLVYFPLALGGLALGLDLVASPLGWVRIVFLVWSIIVEASIFARALSQPLVLGFMIEILYLLPSLSLSEYFAPPTD